ncbi:MAG: hypothetical protein B7Y36_06265 [Novosphingobium sp. 28-62-57]|nr:MAG: hypothetical protein B7Z34_04650 [Novosphingobium sp. 12-62-10]OYZ11733.1 MAG: hypothetical protein B7Y36_06265 [Novosphingobium sp. 28-62-57]OZA33312.1 MAG: hypothetical protein B7X92_11505 [Novosphingobium sp. 17-62-9]
MMPSVLVAVALTGMAFAATPASAAAPSLDKIYQDALGCRVAAQAVLMSLKKAQPKNADEAKALDTVASTETFYRKLSLLLGRTLGKRDPLIGMDVANLQLALAQKILTTPNAMAEMLNKTKTCGDAISEAEKA